VFKLRPVPCTSLLQEQKELRFSPVEAWWEGVLKEYPNHLTWTEEVSPQAIYDNFRLNQASDRYMKTMGVFMKNIRKLCPSIERTRRMTEGARSYVIKLPTIEEARVHFCTMIDDPNWFTEVGQKRKR